MSDSATPRIVAYHTSSVHGIFQAKVLEWVAICFSRGSSHPRDWTWVSHIVGRRFTIWVTKEVWYQILEGCWTFRSGGREKALLMMVFELGRWRRWRRRGGPLKYLQINKFKIQPMTASWKPNPCPVISSWRNDPTIYWLDASQKHPWLWTLSPFPTPLSSGLIHYQVLLHLSPISYSWGHVLPHLHYCHCLHHLLPGPMQWPPNWCPCFCSGPHLICSPHST